MQRLSRRRFLQSSVLAGIGGCAPMPWLAGCASIECSLPIAWSPTVLAPVFYGHQDFSVADGAPSALRVFYPSLAGSPPDAPMVTCLGRYPLVLFLHGQCSRSPPDYRSWFKLPLTLARSGFVVAVPDLGWSSGQAPWQADVPQHALGVDVVDWMHTSWSGREWLSASTTLGLLGHSYGALLAGRLAIDIPATTYVSIGGGWAEHPGVPDSWPIASLQLPSLFIYGTNDIYADPTSWGHVVPTPSHRVILDGGNHWDYLDDTSAVCDEGNGPCGLVDELTADLTAVFLSKQMRVANIPDDLELPDFELTGDQPFYAGAHLNSFDLLPQAGCTVNIEWETSNTGSVELPWS